MHFLESIYQSTKMIRLVVVEPNKTMMESFRKRLLAFDTEGKITSELFEGTFHEFLEASPSAELRYNLITSIHVIPYMGELKKAFTQHSSLLKDNGFLLVHMMSGILLLTFRNRPYIYCHSVLNFFKCSTASFFTRRIKHFPSYNG